MIGALAREAHSETKRVTSGDPIDIETMPVHSRVEQPLTTAENPGSV